MKTFFFKYASVAGMILLLIAAMSTPSCKKDKTCRGKVFVYDTAGQVVGNAKVKLDANAVNGDVTYEAYTDASGTANFEVKLPAIFDVTATKATFQNMEGNGVLRLDEPGKEADVTVVIR
ncbi:MAG: carboxypeptidase regulatory-like domain-containing protein [Bacteroidia bacterium]|nr:carboxypeptidase regulatory-like domain-containing protein [Bacteroidia bacterium]